LAALAHYRQALGLPALVVNWGALAEVGYVAQNPAVSQRLAQAGLSQMPLRQALHLLGELLGYGATEATVSVVQWERWLATYGGEQPPTYVAELGQRTPLEHGAAPLPMHEHPIKDQVAVLQIADPEERWRQLLLHISEQVARVMGITTAKLDREAALTELGLDSLMAVELSNRLNRNLGLNFSLMQLLSGLSVQQMAELMHSQGGSPPGAGPMASNN
jgi:aryl carrier-like protein